MHSATPAGPEDAPVAKPKPVPFRRADNALEKLLATRYGLDPETAPPAVVVMAAEYLMWGTGVPAAQRNLREVNQRRRAAGRAPVRPAAGHALSWEWAATGDVGAG